MATERIKRVSFNPSAVDLNGTTLLTMDYFAAEDGIVTLTPVGVVEPDRFPVRAQPEGAAPFTAQVVAKQRGSHTVFFELHSYVKMAPLKVR